MIVNYYPSSESRRKSGRIGKQRGWVRFSTCSRCSLARIVFIFTLYLSLATCHLSLSSCSGQDIFSSIGTNLANPLSITVDPVSSRAYVVSSNNKFFYDTGSLQVLDMTNPAAPALVSSVELPNFCGQGYLDIASKYLYLTNRLSSDNLDTEDSLLRVNIDEASGSFLSIDTYAAASNPFGVAFDVAASQLYVSTFSDVLDYYSIPTPAAPSTISLSSLSLSDGTTLATAPTSEIAIIGGQAYVVRTSGGLFVVDLAEGNVDYYVSDFASPRGIATDGTNVYLADVEVESGTTHNRLYQISAAAFPVLSSNSTVTVASKDGGGVVLNTVEVGTDPQEVAVGQNYILVSNMGADTVSVISNATFAKAVDDIAVGDEPFGLAIYSPGGTDTHLLVANIQSNTVSIIDLATLTTVTTYQ